MPSAHAQFSPSAAHRWIRCPGSIMASVHRVERRTSLYAAEGTAAHEVREQCLEFGFEPNDFLGETIKEDGFDIEVTEEMVTALEPGIERIRDRPGSLWVEYKVTFDTWLPDQFGTLDTGIVHDDLVEINDLKYGAGLPVSPEENEQLMTYALGFWDNVAQYHTDTKNFLLVIDQPRAAGGGGEWEVHLDDLCEFGITLQAAYHKAHEPDAPLVPGEKQCKFCPIKDECPALAAFAMEAMLLKFDDLDDADIAPPRREMLNAAQRAHVAASQDLIRAWLSSVSGRVLEDALAGQPTPGLKAVSGRKGPRAWRDEKAARKFLLERLDRGTIQTAPKLITPTAAEELLKKKKKLVTGDQWDEFKDLSSQSDGKPVLVSEDDKRDRITTADKFDDLEGEEA